MQAPLILFPLFLTAVSDVSCGPLDKPQHAIKKTCPYPEDIPKCDCFILLGDLYISCEGPMTDSEFQSILKTLQEYSIFQLQIHHYNASSISTDLWKGQYIENLKLINVEVDDEYFIKKGNRHFQGLENSLSALFIENSFKSKRRPLLNLQLDHLKKLRSASFENNNIPEVSNDWFTPGPKKLYNLFFTRNGITKLGDKAFASLSRLEVLGVEGNNLNKLSRSMLPESATFLWRLDLSDNKIRTLPSDIFFEMPALEELRLDNNLIHTIPEDSWISSITTQIAFVTLEGNPLQCDENMKWICKTKIIDKIRWYCSSPPDKKHWTPSKFCQRENDFID